MKAKLENGLNNFFSPKIKDAFYLDSY